MTSAHNPFSVILYLYCDPVLKRFFRESCGVVGRFRVPIRKDGLPFHSDYDAFDASQRLKTIELHRSIPNLRY
jgi:hypothetical protein